jgi:hypothetical protein
MCRFLREFSRSLILFSMVFTAGLFLTACSQQKDVEYFKKHPSEILSSAIECTRLKNDAIQNKTCLAIAELEKPGCERQLAINGVLFAPDGGMVSCNDKYYLIARPIIAARTRAYLEGKPDPLAQYSKQGS